MTGHGPIQEVHASSQRHDKKYPGDTTGGTRPHDVTEVTFKEGSLRHQRKYLSLLSSQEVPLGNYFL